MAARSNDGHRNLVPRWRYTSRTPLTAEHQSNPASSLPDRASGLALAQAEAEWRTSPSAATAVDLISTACAAGKPSVAADCARWLRSEPIKLSPKVLSTVAWITEGAPPRESGWAAPLDVRAFGFNEAKEAVRANRRHLKESRLDVAGWLDLSLAHCILGHEEAARRAMQVALGLAPNHRVVLRIAARLLVHLDAADEAHALIRRHPRTPADPWLMATEISLAQILQQPALFAFKGRKYVLQNDSHPPFISELAAAVGSAERQAGKHHRAHKLYELSLIAPTDNVVAQVQYESQSDRTIQLGKTGLDLPSAMEGRTWRAIMDGRWPAAIDEAVAWQADEPFSSRPAIAVSYAALTVGDADLAVRSTEAGIRANEADQLLRNNFAVALARAGRIQDAMREFAKICPPLHRGYPEYVYDATRGLMAYASGDAALGLKLYERAVRGAPRRDQEIVAMSWVETDWQFLPANRAAVRADIASMSNRLTDRSAQMMARRLLENKIDSPAPTILGIQTGLSIASPQKSATQPPSLLMLKPDGER